MANPYIHKHLFAIKYCLCGLSDEGCLRLWPQRYVKHIIDPPSMRAITTNEVGQEERMRVKLDRVSVLLESSSAFLLQMPIK